MNRNGRLLISLAILIASAVVAWMITVTDAESAPTVTFAAAGDLCAVGNPSSCQGSGALIASQGAQFALTLGDNQYDVGALSQYQASFDKSPWGTAKRAGILHPAPGNHDYKTAGAAGYKSYFGDASPLWYTFESGGVRFIAIDSNVAVASGSAQYTWLTKTLTANTDACVVAYWHHPLYTSGTNHAPDTAMRPIWNLLAANGGDLVLNGHNHQYERFAPQGGMVPMVVGTGMNGSGYNFKSTPMAGSLVRLKGQGLAVFAFDSLGKTWTERFVRPSGYVVDQSTGTC